MPSLSDIKTMIREENISDTFLVFVCEENFFIADEYVDAICRLGGFEKIYADSIFSKQSAVSLILDSDIKLRVIKTDVFAESAPNYNNFDHTIVICNKLDKQLANRADLEDFVVKVPKFTTWQLLAYINTVCPELDETEADFLCKASNNNIYKIENELAKINLFDPQDRKKVFAALRFEPTSDLTSFPVFELVSAIISKDLQKIALCLKYRANCDFEPTGVVTMLLNNYKQILFLSKRFNSGVTPEQLNITAKHANGIDYYNRSYTTEQLRKNIKFLSSIDTRLKTGLFDIAKESQLDYIICNLLG